MAIKYYALFADPRTGTKGFRFVAQLPEGCPKPKRQDNEILMISEAQLNDVIAMLEEHGEPDDFFLFEIEGSGNHTTGACQVVYLGKSRHSKQTLENARKAKKYTQQWLLEIFNYHEMKDIFVKIEASCTKLH